MDLEGAGRHPVLLLPTLVVKKLVLTEERRGTGASMTHGRERYK